MKTQAYLRRIEFPTTDAARIQPTAENLRALHVAHMLSVPFENLDIALGRPIVLDREKIYRKIVVARRGGFCYELNGLFSWLLEQLGFEVTLLSARDLHDDGTFGLEFDHLTLLVRCPADDAPQTPWLADVGWGDSFLEPLRLDTVAEQPQGLRAYRLDAVGALRVLWQRNYEGVWERQYTFTLQPRAFADFAEMCRYHQTSPDSIFTRRRIISRAQPRGRVSLDDGRLIQTTDGQRDEQAIADAEAYNALLYEHFGVRL